MQQKLIKRMKPNFIHRFVEGRERWIPIKRKEKSTKVANRRDLGAVVNENSLIIAMNAGKMDRVELH